VGAEQNGASAIPTISRHWRCSCVPKARAISKARRSRWTAAARRVSIERRVLKTSPYEVGAEGGPDMSVPKAFIVREVEATGSIEVFQRDYAAHVQATVEPYGGCYLASASRINPEIGPPMTEDSGTPMKNTPT
jgi:hypothetical protein